MDSIFDTVGRTFMGPANHNENTFDYYNRSARKDVTIVREKLEEWFSSYPFSEKKELKSRFKKDFDSAFYELFLYQFFKHLGFEIEIHPDIPGSTKHPDFLIKKDNLEIYVEAKVVFDKSHMEAAKERKLNELYDNLDKIESKGFLLNLEKLVFKSSVQPSTKALIKYVEEELKKLDPGIVTKNLERLGREAFPVIKYENRDILIVFKAIPVIPSAREKTMNRAVGMFPIETFWGGSEDSLRASLNEKAKRYGKVDKPFIVCTNVLSYKTSGIFDIENVIWGSSAISWSEDSKNRDEKMIRMRDGIFLDNKGIRLKNLSGIIVTKVSPSNIPTANYWLFKHPFTENVLDFDKIGISYNYIDNNLIVKNTGQNLHEIFNIKKDWLR